ncbi:MAG: hypothetical protein HYV23_07960, partial [Deltaproteobacteria bacterium]|nr:hypothetical protein [Deltaproteobacteria bacterium]
MSIKTFPGKSQSTFLIFLILSVLMHLGIWGALQLLPSGGKARPMGERPPILVDVVDLPPVSPEDLSPVKKPSTHGAQRNQSVAKESWPMPLPKVLLPAPAAPSNPVEQSRPAAKPSQKEGTIQQKTVKEGISPVDEPVKT